ncbi:hypothetical protein Ancab_023586 [Ancistrocladus abbreviatus]
MEDIFLSSGGNDAIPEVKRKGGKVLWRSSVGGTPSKGLINITNLPQKPRLSNPSDKSQFISVAAEERIDQLLKERMALMKQIADRNKIIELSGVELQNLRVNFQKAQLQNFHLAQANSQILAELNAGKDKLKELRHELGCVRSMLTFKNLELQEKKKARVHQETGDETTKPDEAGESSQADNHGGKPSSSKGRRLSKVEVPSTVKGVATREKAEDRRHSLRRQSSRFKTEEQESSEELFQNRRRSLRTQSQFSIAAEQECAGDLFEIDDTQFTASPQLNDRKHGDFTIPMASPVPSYDTEKTNANGSVTHEIRRSSLGRPLRLAVCKVQSYREMSLNKKMRREV